MTRANLRARVPRMFGSQQDADRYAEASEAQRIEQGKRGIRFAVGPAPVTVMAPSGRVFLSAQPISAADLHGDKTSAWSLLSNLIRDGLVIEADSVRDGE